jgi:hypothetical protein
LRQRWSRAAARCHFSGAAFNVVRQRFSFYSAPSVVSKIIAIASTARSQVVVEEGETKRKDQEVERKVNEVEWAIKVVAAPTLAPTRKVKAENSMKNDNIEVDNEGNYVHLAEGGYGTTYMVVWFHKLSQIF